MKHFVAVLFAAAALLQPGCDRTPSIETWDRTFGGEAADLGHSVEPTSDGGYVVAGKTESQGAGESDAWLIKTDAGGNRLWDRTFGGKEPDDGNFAGQTQDGGYAIIGATRSSGDGGWDFWLVKTDAGGSEVWSRTFGGPLGDVAMSGQQTADGGYVMVGSTESYATDSGGHDIWMVKTDADGYRMWAMTYGPGTGWSVEQTADGGYIVTGEASQNNGDLILIKTDTDGDPIWNLTFGGADQEWGFSVRQTADSGYVVGGFTRSYGAGDIDAWLVKTDSSGNLAWRRTYGTEGMEYCNEVKQAADGGYIMAGYESRNGGDAWLIKTDRDGVRLWDKSFGGPGADGAASVIQTPDGGYVVTGSTTPVSTTYGDLWLFKTD